MSFPSFDLISYLREKPSIALIGASENAEKYGSIIYRYLKTRGFSVYPVNRKQTTIHGAKAYANLHRLAGEKSPGLLVFVVPPDVTLEILKDAEELGWKRVWLQPGAGNRATREFLESEGFQFIQDDCVMTKGL